MSAQIREEEARITLTFRGGLADRNRLPFDQVVQTLTEFRELVREVGKRTQSETGQQAPDGDFGLELVADQEGSAFRKGSVRAEFVATKNVEIARIAFASIMAGVSDAEKGKSRQSSPSEQAFVRHMHRIAAYQQPAKNSVVFQVRHLGSKSTSVQLTSRGYEHLEQAQLPRIKVDQQVAYGRLLALRDRKKYDDGESHFWGDLLAENGITWRLRIPASMLDISLKLFRHQVRVEGMAIHYEAGSSRINVSHMELDRERDYVKAFQDLADERLFGSASREELMKELYA